MNTTKTDAGRLFPFGVLPELAELLATQRENTRDLERFTGAIVPWVFHRQGRRIRDYYHAWRAACRRAAADRRGTVEVVIKPHLIGRVMHDFRRPPS